MDGGVFSKRWFHNELGESEFRISEWFIGEEESVKCIHEELSISLFLIVICECVDCKLIY